MLSLIRFSRNLRDFEVRSLFRAGQSIKDITQSEFESNNISQSPPANTMPCGSQGNNIQSPIWYKEYKDGMTAAHDYPNRLLPRKDSSKIPNYIMVYPFSMSPVGDIQYSNRLTPKSITVSGIVTSRHHPIPIIEKLYEKISVVYTFSNQTTNSNPDMVLNWKRRLDSMAQSKELSHIFLCVKRAYPWNEWLIKSGTQFLSPKFTEVGNFLGYFGNVKNEMKKSLHLHRPGLASILLVDPHCYVRWHAIGNPTNEALESLKKAIGSLKLESLPSNGNNVKINFANRRININ